MLEASICTVIKYSTLGFLSQCHKDAKESTIILLFLNSLGNWLAP